MKKKILNIFIFSVVLLINVGGSKTIFSQQAQTTDEIEAENVLMSYFDSLTTGDTETIINLLGGDLLKKRTALLNNPDYPEFLRNMYSNAFFEIVGHEQIKENKAIKAIIDAKIILNDQESMQVRYFLKKTTDPTDLTQKFCIHEQREQMNDSF